MLFQTLLQKYREKKYPKANTYSFTVLDGPKTNERMNELLDSTDPFFVARFGTVEASALYSTYWRIWHLYEMYPKEDKTCLSRNAGMFSNTALGRLIFFLTVKKSIRLIDYLFYRGVPEEGVLMHMFGKRNPLPVFLIVL